MKKLGKWLWVHLTTVDHKRIGAMYVVTAAIMLLFGGVEAFLIRLQLFHPDNRLVVGDSFNQLVTMHGTTMIFFAIMPLFVGFANVIMPLQIGARDVAFPFLNAFSYWLYLAGCILLQTALITGDMPNDGWFAYPPLSLKTYNPGFGMDYYAMSIQISGLGTFITGINFVVTILNMRAPGMTLRRMPLFTWAVFIMSTVIIFAFPPLTADVFLLIFDRLMGMNFFNVAQGGNVLIWQHLFWIFGHPEVYILILPAFGIISEVVTTFSRKNLFGYDSMILALVAIAFISFTVWSHHLFTAGMGPIVNSIFATTTMLIAIPTGVKIFNWIGTLWGGKIRTTSAMLYALGFIPIFVVGGITGVMVAMAPADYQYNMSYFVVAHFHYVMIGGSLFSLLAALYYWFPKIWGRLLDERLGRLSFALMFVGFNATFFPQHWLGLFGMARRVFTYPPDWGLTFWNQFSTIGLIVMTLGLLVVMYDIIITMVRGQRAPADPWDGRTLEWATSSPPPLYNFPALPPVTSRDAWWVMKRQGIPLPEPERDIHMPAPTLWPFLLALGMTVVAYGVIYPVTWLAWGGVFWTLYALYRSLFDRVPPLVLHPEVRA